MKALRSLCFVNLFLSIIIFAACGGSGGTGTQSNSSYNTGSVALFLADGPADAYEAINIWIKEVSLIPPEESARESIIIYESQDPNGFKINLLDYVDNDFLLTLRHHIPAGYYEKIRLNIIKMGSEGGDCDQFKVPSNKIDLNPRRGFYVEQDATLAIRLDIDANKSINLHSARDKCIFRPVVFIDIETIKSQPLCPKILKGEIADLIDGNTDEEIEGFVLDLLGNRGNLDVYISNDSLIFNDEGYPANNNALTLDQIVWVRGRLDSEGHFLATEVVIGEIGILKGTVENDVQNQEFLLSLAENQLVFDPNISVQLTEGTLILVGCDNEVKSSAIKPGLQAKVFGKLSVDNQIFRAIIVVLRPVSGELISINAADHSSDQGTVYGRDLIIRDNENNEITIFLPESAPICLVGNGEVPINLLCPGRQIQVTMNPELSEGLEVLTALDLKVHPDHIGNWVSGIDNTNNARALDVDGNTVYVQYGATIMDLRGKVDNLVDFGNIRIEDKVSCFGLEACPSDTSDNDFYAFVVLII